MHKVFIGYDPRQPVAYNTAQYAVIKNASKPVSITPLILGQLPIDRRGLTEFTFTRFLVPHLCGYRGKALFIDPDMIVTGDVCELIDGTDWGSAVSLVEDQPRFEWPSMMVFKNDRCKTLTVDYVQSDKNQLFDLAWANSVEAIGKEWNHCVGYCPPNPSAKLFHYTQGLPCWPETDGIESEVWHDNFKECNSTVSWQELMGGSIHAEPVLKRLANDN